MSKAVLMIDMPEKCWKCPFYYEGRDKDDDWVSFCGVLDDEVIDGFTDRYYDCPLELIVKCKDCSNVEYMDDVWYCHHWSKNTEENGYCHEWL